MKARRYAAAMADWAAAVEAYDGEGGGAAGDGAALALEMHGMFLHLLGEYEKAMGRYDRAHALAPRQVSTLLMRSSLWYELEDPKKAHGDMDAALALAPQDADIFCHRGQLCMLLGNNTEAIGDLRKSVRLDGGSVLARIQLGMGLHRSQKQTEAQEVFTDAVTTFPDSPEALNYHGEMLVEMNKIDDARAQFEKAVAVSEGRCARRARLEPRRASAQPHATSCAPPTTAQVRARPRQPRRAADAPRRRRRRRAQGRAHAIAVDPLCETAHVHLAHLHLQRNDLEAAIAAYDRGIALLRVKQELVDCYSMREAAAAQHKLLTEQAAIYAPVMEENRARMKEGMARMQQ